MEQLTRISLAVIAFTALASCGGPPPDTDTAAEPEPGGQQAEETVFDDMIQTQDRARAVEGVVMDRKKDLDTAIDHAEDNEPSE